MDVPTAVVMASIAGAIRPPAQRRSAARAREYGHEPANPCRQPDRDALAAVPQLRAPAPVVPRHPILTQLFAGGGWHLW